jgi:hypothetical protein
LSAKTPAHNKSKKAETTPMVAHKMETMNLFAAKWHPAQAKAGAAKSQAAFWGLLMTFFQHISQHPCYEE